MSYPCELHKPRKFFDTALLVNELLSWQEMLNGALIKDLNFSTKKEVEESFKTNMETAYDNPDCCFLKFSCMRE